MNASTFEKVLHPALDRDNMAADDLLDEDGMRICAVCGEKK